MKAKLTPVYEKHKGKDEIISSVECVLVHIGNYPVFMAHSDFIHDACVENRNHDMYERLQAGEMVEVDITVIPIGES